MNLGKFECVLCGNGVDEHNEDLSYSYDQFLSEADKKGLVCCKECKEILRSNKSRHVPKKEIIKVKITKSDYPLPGYVPVAAKNGVYYIKPGKRKSRVRDFAR